LVVIKGTEFFDGKQKRYVDFPVTDVLQMMGRAGRPQFDDSGVACVLVHEPKKNFYRKFLHEPFPLESSLHLHLHNHLNAEIASDSVNSIIDCVELISWTFFFRRLMMNPSYYGLKEFTNEAVSEFLNSMVVNVLKELQSAGCITFDEDNGVISCTDVGRICSTYYVDYKTVSFFKNEIQMMNDSDCSAENFSYILSLAQEFSELPVRHNEELLNADLAESLPWSADGAPMDSSHTKTFLLLQAHFFRKKLPISGTCSHVLFMLSCTWLTC
jgi:activating signal cointegrator complex subunit 3